jgi:hypothetical protein
MDVRVGPGENGRGKLVTLSHLDNEKAHDLQLKVEAFMKTEAKDVYFNSWDMREKGQDFVIDIYVEDDMVLHRLEDYLSIFGYRLRLTPKKLIIT